MANQTGVVDINSVLQRTAWLKEGLVQQASKSYWTPLTGTSADSVVYQKNDLNAKNGQNVVFDYDGFLSGEGFRGAEQAFGKGENKRKFSATLDVEFGRYAVNNGLKFRAAEIDATDLTNHADSRTKLADLWVRAKDQAIFDAAQGFLRAEAPTHYIRPNSRATTGALVSGDVMDWDFLMEIQECLETGRGYEQGGTRMPLLSYNGYWHMMIDPYQKYQLLNDDKFRSIMSAADTRGDGNRIIASTLGTIGKLKILEAPSHWGSASSNKLFKQSVEIAGLRTMDASLAWQGTAAFDGTPRISRGLILGRSALQLAFGEMPDYKFQPSTDFQISSESAMEVTYNVKKTQLLAEDEDYTEAKAAGFNFGLVAFETYIG